jgi:hypothetical protein
VRLLVVLRQVDRLGEVVLVEELRELGRELRVSAWAARIAKNFWNMIVSDQMT